MPAYNINQNNVIWCSDLSKTHVLSEHKTQEKHVLLFFATLPPYHKANEEA